MITSAQASEYLDKTLGISVPDFVLRAAVEQVEALESEMVDAGYGEATQVLVQTYAVAVIAAAGDPRRINSQGAPSGANRSFKNGDKALSALRRSLAAADTAGITADLVGPDPAAATLMMVVA